MRHTEQVCPSVAFSFGLSHPALVAGRALWHLLPARGVHRHPCSHAILAAMPQASCNNPAPGPMLHEASHLVTNTNKTFGDPNTLVTPHMHRQKGQLTNMAKIALEDPPSCCNLPSCC